MFSFHHGNLRVVGLLKLHLRVISTIAPSEQDASSMVTYYLQLEGKLPFCHNLFAIADKTCPE